MNVDPAATRELGANERGTTRGFYDILHRSYFPILRPTKETVTRNRTLRCIQLMEGCRPHDVLEIGFEDPRLSKLIASRWNYVGVDVSEVSVKAALDEGLRAIALDVSRETLPFDDGTFDLVYCAEVMEHLLDPDFAFHEFKRVLRLGGKILMTTPNLASWYNRILLLFGIQPIHTEVSTIKILGRKFHMLGQGGRPVGHIRPFTLRGLLDFLHFQNLEVLQVEGYSLDIMQELRFLDKILSKFTPLSSGFIAMAEKSLEAD